MAEMAETSYRAKTLTTMAIASSLMVLLTACGGNSASYDSGGMRQTSAAGKDAGKDNQHLIYPGATTSGAQAAKEEGKEGDYVTYIQLSSKDPVEKIADWYESTLKKDGWNVERTENMGKLIQINGNRKLSEINVTLNEDESANSTILISESSSVGAIPDDETVETFKPNKDVPPTD